MDLSVMWSEDMSLFRIAELQDGTRIIADYMDWSIEENGKIKQQSYRYHYVLLGLSPYISPRNDS